ncbi:hypothetical protein [Ovoidimarina sediminis]|uniref:hypothetical protein n=1 Tax=Ovoidimarina sediminis TaxID=3079856 RepID=UPI00290AD7BA|nr:hypothetical protein [Rhodophyticola sp. MJ-SS7]MDU8944317.1 hypothetical protein [Rhodophyticola sp. MJ-SS7]
MTLWTLGFVVGVVVVLVVALLLIGILMQARRIRGLADAAAGIVAEIDANTRSVWALKNTNAVAADLLEGARAIDTNAAAIVKAVSHEDETTAA